MLFFFCLFPADPPLPPMPHADDQSDFGFDDIWDPAFRPKRFSGSWYGGKYHV